MDPLPADRPAARPPQPSADAPPGTRARASVFDKDALVRLQALDPQGTGGLVKRVLETYAQSLERQGAALEAAMRAGDIPELGRLAHSLKSSSGSVGASRLAARFAALERWTRDATSGGDAVLRTPDSEPLGNDPSAQLAAEMAGVLHEIDLARTELRAMLSN